MSASTTSGRRGSPQLLMSPARLPRALYLLLLLTWIVCLPDPSLAQNMEIRTSIREQLLPGYVILNLATDPKFVSILESSAAASPQSDLRFSILTSGNPNSLYFGVGEKTGIVEVAKTIDREYVCSFRSVCVLDFEVAARSEYGVFFVLVNFVVEVTDFNDNPPEFTQAQFELYVPENSVRGRSFQLPVAFDRDTGPENGVSEYRILKGPDLFDLVTTESGFNSSDVYLTLQSTVNRESAPSYKILVGAIDGGQPSLTGTLTVEVHVSDINDNFPVFERPVYVVNIPEDTRNDQIIQQVKATDADTGPNGELVYSFSSLQPLDDLQYFGIKPKTGEIYVTQSVESRTGQDIELLVEASDQGHPPKVSRTRVQIQVEDTVNSMPEIMVDTLGGIYGVAEVSEYGEIGKVVAHVSVRDSDSGDNGRTDCNLSGPEFRLVKLDNKGKYKAVLMSSLDRELVSMYNVTVSCSDHGFPSLLATRDFAVQVLDENDQTPKFSQRTYEASMYENNKPGVLVKQLTVTDGDTGENAQVFFEVVGINKRFFSVFDNGSMVAMESLDRELTDRIVTTIVVTDRGKPPLSSTATVIVNLLDVNDVTPYFSEMIFKFEVTEGNPGSRFVGIVSASDDDVGANKNVFYHLPLEYTQTENNFVIGTDGGVIKTNKVLDREEKETHNFLVLATDRGTPARTGTASVIITVLDINDNDPYFLFPNASNDSLVIPHTFDKDERIVSIKADDRDKGLNSALVYSVSSINESAPFAVNPQTGSLYLNEKLTSEDVGLYTLTLMAHDQGTDKQRATQYPLYVEVYFDNSTLLAALDAGGPSKTMIMAVVISAVLLVILVTVLVTYICYKKYEAKKSAGGVPNSASTSSTTKLHGGYYIAPGVRGSSSSFIGKQEDGTCNSGHEMGEGMKTSNPYVVMVPAPSSERDTAPEIVEISRPGHPNGLNDTLNTDDLDQTDDGQFSTFKSQEDILSPGIRQGSLSRRAHDTSDVKRPINDTFDDDMSCDSTSDSGRGGSDVENGAAAAKEKARAQAATPISVKSGISNRLSPLPREHERTFHTFRGDSPSSFPFDSDSDTLTRPQRLRASPMPMMATPSRRDIPRFEPGATSSLSRYSESDTDNDLTPRGRPSHPPPPPPLNIAGIHNPNSSFSGFSSGGEGSTPRQPVRVAPLPMFMGPSMYQRHDSETDHSDAGSNPSSSLSRRNHVPRLPYYPGIEFTHHAYGGSNRNSISAFSNHSSASASDGYYPDPHQAPLYSPSASRVDYNRGLSNTSSGAQPYNYDYNNPQTFMPDGRVSGNYGNVVSELQDSRPVSMEEDFLLPPYPEVDEEEEQEAENLAMHSGFTGFSPERDAERAALFDRSRFESSA